MPTADRSIRRVRPTRANLPRTPVLAGRLAALRRTLALAALLAGTGRLLLAAAAALGLCFAADWSMVLPAGVRLALEAAALAALAWVAWRALLAPLASLPGARELALVHERADRGFAELIVSAVELQLAGLPRDADPALAALVLERAEARAGALAPARVTSLRRPAAAAALGLASIAGAAFLLARAPEHARAFLERALLGDARWPQRTHLSIELALPQMGPPAESRGGPSPPGATAARDERIHVRLARGADLGVLVRADGAVPDSASLVFGDGARQELARTGDTFRTVLRALSADLAFHAEGGDDRDALPSVEVEVLTPPDLAAIAVLVEPPAYALQPARWSAGGDADFLRGSRVSVIAAALPADCAGSARILPEDHLVTLSPAVWPDDAALAGAGVEAGRASLAFVLEPASSLRYRLELSDARGLGNPAPALYALQMIEDRAPAVAWIAPARSLIETTAAGRLRLTARASDDFGVAALEWRAAVIDAGGVHAPASGALALEPAPPPGAAAPRDARGTIAPRDARGTIALEVAELLDADAGASALALSVAVEARDTRAPEAQSGTTEPLRVSILSADELLRHLQDRLAAARRQGSRLAELLAERASRLELTLEALASDGPERAASAQELAAASAAARHAKGQARELAAELADVAATALYARVDPKSGAWLERLDALSASSAERGFDPRPWRALAGELEQAGGARGVHGAQGAQGAQGASGGGLGALFVELAGLATEIDDEHCARAAAECARAGTTAVLAERAAALEQALDDYRAAAARLEELLAKLSEWDDFQAVIQLAQDILERQRALYERTRGAAGAGNAPGSEK